MQALNEPMPIWLVVAMVILACGLTYGLTNEKADIAARVTLTNNCHSGNVTRAYELIDGQGDQDVDYELVTNTYRLRDCEATIENEGDAVYLSSPDSRAFVALYSSGRCPRFTDGHLVDVGPLPC